MSIRKKVMFIPICIAVMLCMLSAQNLSYAAEEAPLEAVVWQTPKIKTQDGHQPYMEGKNGAFRPMDYFTRGEFCHALCSIFDFANGGNGVYFFDIYETTPYAEEIYTASAAGMVKGHYNGSFYPDMPISKAEVIESLCKTISISVYDFSFEDIKNHPAGAAIEYAYREGWISPYSENAFRPDDPISRADAAVLINKFLKRSATKSKSAIDYQKINPFYDVSPDSKYFCDVVEATVTHKSTGVGANEAWYDFTYLNSGFSAGVVEGIGFAVDSNGQFRRYSPEKFVEIAEKTYYTDKAGCIDVSLVGVVEIGDALYCFNEDHSVLKNGYYGHAYFGSDGKYTTKSSTMDKLVDNALKKCTTSEMTKEQKLRAAYKYLRDNCKYLSRPHHPRGTSAFVMESAKFMFRNMRGNCYCYASCFLLMARRIGYTQAYVVSGGVGTKNSDHAWVMIDGNIFDPELEYAYRYRYAVKKDYDLYNMKIDSTPFPYHFPK